MIGPRIAAVGRALGPALVALIGIAAAGAPASAQEVRIRELTSVDSEVPYRLLGYGLVVGLDGTGDRAVGGAGAGHTVRSVTNLLRRFGIEVPPEMLRTRNVAAVLVTAEVSPYLRPGGRFEVQVASLGDAMSLRGGVLWATPLGAGVGQPPVATAQGALLISSGAARRDAYTVETSARLVEGGLLEAALPAVDFGATSRLVLREPNLGTAIRVANAINEAAGEEVATVEDPGSVAIQAPGQEAMPVFLARVQELTLEPDRAARIVIDSRDGTVVAGGDLVVGEAVVSHGTLTLSIGAADPESQAPGDVRVPEGTRVQDVAAALHAVAATPPAISAVFRSLREVGAIAAEVVVR